eukprot:1688757-Pleurochrysis_carterae.AAC.2
MSAIFESGVDDAAWRERLLAERRWQKECGASTCAPVCGSKGRKLRSIEPEPYRSSAEALGLRDYSTGTHANRCTQMHMQAHTHAIAFSLALAHAPEALAMAHSYAARIRALRCPHVKLLRAFGAEHAAGDAGNEPCGGGGQFGVPQHARQHRAMTASRSVPMLDPIHVRCSALMGTLHSGSVLPCSSVELREIEAKARLRAEERELRDLDCEIGRRLEAAQARALNSCNRIASTTSQAQFQALKNFSPDFARPSRLELESGAWTAGRWSRR